MTIKYPVVGKKYKHKYTGDVCSVSRIDISEESIIYRYLNSNNVPWRISLADFNYHFEEMPEQEEPVEINKGLYLNKEVIEAIDMLQIELFGRVLPSLGLFNDGQKWQDCYNDLKNQAQTLLDALNKFSKHASKPAKIKIDSQTSQTSQTDTIWNPINNKHIRELAIIMVKVGNMYSKPAIWDGKNFVCQETGDIIRESALTGWLYPSDLIKSHESLINKHNELKARIEKLENK